MQKSSDVWKGKSNHLITS